MVLLRMLRKGVVSMRKCWKCWIVGLFVDFGQFYIQNPTQFSRTCGAKTSLIEVYCAIKPSILFLSFSSFQNLLTLYSRTNLSESLRCNYTTFVLMISNFLILRFLWLEKEKYMQLSLKGMDVALLNELFLGRPVDQKLIHTMISVHA